MKNRIAFVILLLGGCAVMPPQPEITLEREFALSMGGDGFDFLEQISAAVVDDIDTANVKVAFYSVHPLAGQDVDFREVNFDDILRASNPGLSWDTIVKVNDEDEKLWVFVGVNLERQVLAAVSIFRLS